MQPAQINNATTLRRLDSKSGSHGCQQTALLTINSVDMCMRTALLFDKARSVIACYQAGKNGNGENHEQQRSETRKTRIRDKTTTDNPEDDSKPGRGIEYRLREETQRSKRFAGQGSNTKNHSFAGSESEQREGRQTQNDAKAQCPRMFRCVAHSSHVALRVNRYYPGEICRNLEIEWVSQCRIQLTHEETLRPQFRGATGALFEMFFER